MLVDEFTQLLLARASPSPALVVCALVAVVLWLLMRRVHGTRRVRAGESSRRRRVVGFVARVGVGTGALWLAFNALPRAIELDTSWPLWVCAALGGAGVEAITSFYALERRTVPPITSFGLGALRITLLLTIITMLAQPSFVARRPVDEQRFVAVLLDDSASMDLSDSHSSASEKLAWAEALLTDLPARPFRVRHAIDELRGLPRDLETQVAWLELVRESGWIVTPDGPLERRTELQKALGATADAADGVAGRARSFAANRASGGGVATRLKAVADVIEERARDPLRDAARRAAELLPGSVVSPVAELLGIISGALEALNEAAEALAPLVAEADVAWLASLTEDHRAAVDSVTARSRRALARELLLDAGDGAPPFDELTGRYVVRLYRFASGSTPTTATAWREQDLDGTPPPAARLSTDLATALDRVREELPTRKLAGVMIVTDGRHNAKRSVREAARWFGAQGTPVCSLVTGSLRPPVDAAIVSVTAPRVVQLRDELRARVELKADGLAGKTAELELVHEGKAVGQARVAIDGDTFRGIVDLIHRSEQIGLAEYRVRVKPLGNELVENNNSRTVCVNVTDEPIQLLLIDDRPRWEFRYIRSLFADRDRSVKLQYLLAHPDRIEGAPPQPVIRASTSRGIGECEANALPETAADWFAFDAIILGDVPRQALDEDAAKILERYVGEHGGRVVVIAGSRHMPAAYADSVLRPMIPVHDAPSEVVEQTRKEPGFRIALTPQGDQHTVLRLERSDEANRLAWATVPDIHWRHPIRGVRPGATVLAFAMPFAIPDFYRRQGSDVADRAELVRKRERFARQRALIVEQSYGLGRVMALNFDSTWRLRYRKGDPYHHRLWAQMLRWATSDRLAAGNDQVRLGTDQPVYAADEPVRVRARLRDGERRPVSSAAVSITVSSSGGVDAEEVVVYKRLESVADAPGMYAVDLGLLAPAKRYRISVEVEDPAHLELSERARGVTTEIHVEPAGGRELAELSAYRVLADQLAESTGARVLAPDEASDLGDIFGPGNRVVVVEDRYPLWYSWPLLLVALLAATGEWAIRKKAGLA